MQTGTNYRYDARELAKLLISRYGEQAVAYASHQSLKARSQGEPRLMEAWRWVAGAAAELLRSEPDEDEPG
jgi:hypothetical protein